MIPDPASATAPDDRRQRWLRSYIGQLTVLMEQGGWTILHHNDLSGPAPHTPAAHYLLAEATTLPRLRSNINELAGIGGFVRHAAKDGEFSVLALPDESGVLGRMAALAGLDEEKLRARGITDLDIYAQIFIHEATHIIGRDITVPASARHIALRDETATYALHTLRYLRHGGLPAAERLFGAFTCTNNLLHALKDPREKSSHAGSAIAVDWARAHYMDNFIAGRRDGMTGKPPEAPSAEALVWARSALRRRDTPLGWGAPEARTRIIEDCFAAAAELTGKGSLSPHGPSIQLRAALPLRQLGRALREISSYDAGPA